MGLVSGKLVYDIYVFSLMMFKKQGNAPLSKFILFLTIGMTLLCSMTNLNKSLSFSQDSLQHLKLWQLFSNQLFFSSNPELFWGCILLYYFRLFERQWGTSKFAAFSVICYFFSTLIQLLFMVSAPFLNRWPSGP